MRQWMEDHHPRLIGLWDWPRYRLFGDCWAQGCTVPGRLNILHSPWRLFICERTPMAVEITEQGMTRYRELAGDPTERANVA